MSREIESQLASCELHLTDISEIESILRSDKQCGLSSEEAAKRLEHFGLNEVSQSAGTPAWKRFLIQFHQPLVYILLVASLVTALLQEWVDSGVILGVVVINAIIGYIQEAKAEKAIDALNKMVVTEATVRRDGKKTRIPSAKLVPGDVVLLQSGDRVPADLRLFQVINLHCDESALTGESLPVAKHSRKLDGEIALADRKNQAFGGSLVTAGQAEGLVWATGDKTETGRIAWLISEAVELATPLTRKIAQFSHFLLWVIVGLAACTFLLGVFRGESAVDMFMAAVALAVGAIPEGLPAAVTIVLAVGVSRMAKRRAIIRKLPAVETLGSTTVICSDKTGTLTENQMTVQELYCGESSYELTGLGYTPEGEIRCGEETIAPHQHPALMECLKAGLLCNDSSLVIQDGRHAAQGDPTEVALIVAAAKAGLDHDSMTAALPRYGMIPFESDHMFRATLHRDPDAPGARVYLVGAVEQLLDRCVDRLGDDASPIPIDTQIIRQQVETMAERGLRVLALARLELDSETSDIGHDDVATGLTFLGLQAMIDPPRAEAIEAVAHCRQAGIQVKMITGDHILTASVIARKVGLVDAEEEIHAINGLKLSKISDDEVPKVAEETEVFARVAPEQKLRLVRALQKRQHIVAMTGDGVNDAPALKQADIGIAMGITGTEVAKGAADMILTDDNFASIEAAVEEGRGVFDNLTKFIVWTLPTNLGEGGIILVAVLLGVTLPVLPVQILWVNMSTALLLGLMLVFEPKEKGLMDRAPRDPSRPILTPALILRTLLVSGIIIAGGFWLFERVLDFEGDSLDAARTAVVNTIVMVETAYLFGCRSLRRSVFSLGLLTNPLVLLGAGTMILLQLLFTYAPFMNQLFHTTPLPASTWGLIALISLVAFVCVEFEKFFRSRCGNSKFSD